MSKRIPEPTQRPKERAFLVGVDLRSDPSLLTMEDSLAELTRLAETAGLEVVGETYQRMEHPNVETYVGSGKVEEIRALAEEMLADVIIFDNELSPRHLRELEQRLPKLRFLDRTALILDIFAQHAHTREGALQVELAQYEYRLPRLTRAWTHLARQAGGGGGRSGSVGGVGLRGPGETQLEVDRREIRKRISTLRAELEKVRVHRQRYRLQRKRTRIPVISLVGYTNAGKSTLLNTLSRAGVFAADQLFATLDPTTRRVELPGDHVTLFTDTVGFIQKLPTQLVAAFRATLEEINEADLLLHVVDISHPNADAQYRSVQLILEEIKADHIPVITALNKTDRLADPQAAQNLIESLPNAYLISALTKQGLPELLKAIESQLYETMLPVRLRIPYQQGQIIALFHDQGQVSRVEHGRGGVQMDGLIPGRLFTTFQPFFVQDQPEPDDEESID